MAVRDVSQWALQDHAGKQTRSGLVLVTALETSKAVTFAAPMPSTGYTVLWERGGSTISVLWVSDKTTDGFHLNLSVGLVETLKYLAVED